MENLRTAIERVLEYSRSSSEMSVPKAINNVCGACEEELWDVCKAILDSNHEVPRDKPIIHYTSVDVLTCIFNRLTDEKNQQVSLRAYDTIHLNDPQEGDFLTNLIKEKHDWLQDHNKNGQTGHAYIASFILQKEEMQDNKEETQDNLVFWRTYGKGGKGCSLLAPIENLFNTSYPKLYRVRYGDECANEAIEKMHQKIQDIKRELQALKDSLTTEQCKYLDKEIDAIIWRTLDKIRFLYKSKAYEYENECRFVLTNKRYDPKSREKDKNEEKVIYEYKDWGDGAPRIRHYFEPEDLDIRKLLSTGSVITLGPLVPHEENVKYCLERMMKKCEIHGAKIKISDISYREA